MLVHALHRRSPTQKDFFTLVEAQKHLNCHTRAHRYAQAETQKHTHRVLAHPTCLVPLLSSVPPVCLLQLASPAQQAANNANTPYKFVAEAAELTHP